MGSHLALTHLDSVSVGARRRGAPGCSGCVQPRRAPWRRSTLARTARGPSDVASVSACERLLSAGQKLSREVILAAAHDPVLRMATAHSSRVFAGCTS